jgi:ABC-type glutathione transport system ATPase component
MSTRTKSQSIIQIHDLSKVYSTAAGEFSALRQVNTDVQAGEFLAIFGKSGAGKRWVSYISPFNYFPCSAIGNAG